MRLVPSVGSDVSGQLNCDLAVIGLQHNVIREPIDAICLVCTVKWYIIIVMASVDNVSVYDSPSVLATVRDFWAPTVEDAIMSLNLASGARVLDMGTGAGGALPAISRAVGMTGSVLAVDKDSTVLSLASDYAEQAGVVDHVTFQVGDIVDVLADAATAPENAFDVIWASDVLYAVYFEEPADVVRLMAQALRPGGIIALFYPNGYHSAILTGHTRLERCVYNALEIDAGVPVDGPRHRERHLTWLLAADLDEVGLTMLPRVCFPIDTDPTVRLYLEMVTSKLYECVTTYGAVTGLSAAEINECQRLLTSGDPDYIFNEPGYYLMYPALL
jgi:2-polyprenyl-3-methyl-5-hydroxy-6-metoxy-1,4-benzoquinol methylase